MEVVDRHGTPAVAEASGVIKGGSALFVLPDSGSAVIQHHGIELTNLFQHKGGIGGLVRFQKGVIEEALHAQGSGDELVPMLRHTAGDGLCFLRGSGAAEDGEGVPQLAFVEGVAESGETPFLRAIEGVMDGRPDPVGGGAVGGGALREGFSDVPHMGQRQNVKAVEDQVEGVFGRFVSV